VGGGLLGLPKVFAVALMRGKGSSPGRQASKRGEELDKLRCRERLTWTEKDRQGASPGSSGSGGGTSKKNIPTVKGLEVVV